MAISQGPPAQEVNQGFLDQLVGTLGNTATQFIDAFANVAVEGFLPNIQNGELKFGPAPATQPDSGGTPTNPLGVGGSINIAGTEVSMGLLLLIVGGGFLLFAFAK